MITLKKLLFAIVTGILILSLANTVLADLSVGVKEGDWIAYQVSYTGSPVEGHDVDWASMEVLDVQGASIKVLITSKFSDGSTEQLNATLNLDTGHLIDDFIIPANLNAGDAFYDENYGNVTINKAEQHTYAGATRTVLYASTHQSTFVFDQATGVCVEGKTQTDEYSMHTLVEDTNMWQSTEGQNWTVIYAAIVTVIIIVALATCILLHKRKKRT